MTELSNKGYEPGREILETLHEESLCALFSIYLNSLFSPGCIKKDDLELLIQMEQAWIKIKNDERFTSLQAQKSSVISEFIFCGTISYDEYISKLKCIKEERIAMERTLFLVNGIVIPR